MFHAGSYWKTVSFKVWKRFLFYNDSLHLYSVGMASMYMGFNAVLGLVSDIPYMAGIIIGAAVVMIYTWTGGARAVAWTDTICMVLMIFAIIVTLTTPFIVAEDLKILLWNMVGA